MKNLKFICLLMFGLLYTTCDFFEEVSMECSSYDLEVSSISFNLKVSTIFHHNVKPLPDQEVKIETYKKVCGKDEVKPGSLFTFTGLTDSGGNFDGNMVGYELRNLKDAIIVNIYYLKDNGSWFLVEHQEYNAEFFQAPINPRVLQYYFDI